MLHLHEIHFLENIFTIMIFNIYSRILIYTKLKLLKILIPAKYIERSCKKMEKILIDLLSPNRNI